MLKRLRCASANPKRQRRAAKTLPRDRCLTTAEAAIRETLAAQTWQRAALRAASPTSASARHGLRDLAPRSPTRFLGVASNPTLATSARTTEDAALDTLCRLLVELLVLDGCAPSPALDQPQLRLRRRALRQKEGLRDLLGERGPGRAQELRNAAGQEDYQPGPKRCYFTSVSGTSLPAFRGGPEPAAKRPRLRLRWRARC